MINLIELKTKIENLSKEHQIEILRLLLKDKNITLNENKNGTFINLSQMNDSALESLNTYLSYITIQNKQLEDIETEKNNIEKQFFTNI